MALTATCSCTTQQPSTSPTSRWSPTRLVFLAVALLAAAGLAGVALLHFATKGLTP